MIDFKNYKVELDTENYAGKKLMEEIKKPLDPKLKEIIKALADK